MLIKDLIPSLFQKHETTNQGYLAIRALRQMCKENSIAESSSEIWKKSIVEVINKAYPGIIGDDIETKLKYQIGIELDEIDLDWLNTIDSATREEGVIRFSTKVQKKIVRWLGIVKLYFNSIYKLKLDGELNQSDYDEAARAIRAAALVHTLKDKTVAKEILAKYEFI